MRLRVYVLYLVGLITLGFLDTYTTYVLVFYMGMPELNPFVRMMLDAGFDMFATFLLKDLSTLPIFACILYFVEKTVYPKYREKAVYLTVFSTLLTRSVAVVWNCFWLVLVPFAF